MIEIDGLTKRYGDKTAVDGLSFVVKPGVVTGFLGPNGAGKSTTMRVIAGLDRPTSGTVRVNGKRYPHAAAPMSELGILLDARSVHPGLSARNNLLTIARTAGIGRRRVDEVIELAGLGGVGRQVGHEPRDRVREGRHDDRDDEEQAEPVDRLRGPVRLRDRGDHRSGLAAAPP
jgi:ABC-2 type transport system ATP-binding protein